VKQQSADTGSNAVSYLRVSSLGQVETDFDPEGISLPAQRKAIIARAKELDAVIVNEFTDPGKSAKSIEHRAAFREMIAYLKANRNVRYVIVYALSRFARNRYDAIMMMTLEKLGVKLISTTEKNLDESPAGRAMHGMIAVFNEYQVRVSGEDIKYKMGQKAKNGGTLGAAKIGYRNVRINYDGREVRAIDIDPERAPFVKMAFELYATGNYSFPELRDALTDAGLRTRGNRRYGPDRSPSTASATCSATATTSDSSPTTASNTPADTKPSSTPSSSTGYKKCSTWTETPEPVNASMTTISKAPSGAPDAAAGSSCGPAPAKPAGSTSTTSAGESKKATATCQLYPCTKLNTLLSNTTARSASLNNTARPWKALPPPR